MRSLAASASALALLLSALACSGGGSAGPHITSFTASPGHFLPRQGVQLTAEFTGGRGRVDPGGREISSGVPLDVGPSAAGLTFTLTVDDGASQVTRALAVPFRYRDRITVLPPLPVARADHAAVLLADGRVMLAGGRSAENTSHMRVDLLDPDGGTCVPTGELSVHRDGLTPVYLAAGRVLVAGGLANEQDGAARRVEVWDPATGAWSTAGSLAAPRDGGTITALPGLRLLAFGGANRETDPEVFDPATGATRPTAGAPLAARRGHTATALATGTGQVLIVGGNKVPGTPGAELYDPEADAFAATGAPGAVRTGHLAARLRDGRVLIAGGQDAVTGEVLGSAELWSAEAGGFTPAGPLLTPRLSAPALVLVSGEVLVAGGSELVPGDPAPSYRPLATMELFDPVTGSFRASAARLPGAVLGHSMTLLGDGRVLIAGGDRGDGFPVATLAIYD